MNVLGIELRSSDELVFYHAIYIVRVVAILHELYQQRGWWR
jgi:hypothetical protein